MAILFISVLSDHRASLFLSFACEVLSPALLMALGSLCSSAGAEDASWAWRVQRLMMGRASGTVTNLKPNFLGQKWPEVISGSFLAAMHECKLKLPKPYFFLFFFIFFFLRERESISCESFPGNLSANHSLPLWKPLNGREGWGFAMLIFFFLLPFPHACQFPVCTIKTEKKNNHQQQNTHKTPKPKYRNGKLLGKQE